MFVETVFFLFFPQVAKMQICQTFRFLIMQSVEIATQVAQVHTWVVCVLRTALIHMEAWVVSSQVDVPVSLPNSPHISASPILLMSMISRAIYRLALGVQVEKVATLVTWLLSFRKPPWVASQTSCLATEWETCQINTKMKDWLASSPPDEI